MDAAPVRTRGRHRRRRRQLVAFAAIAAAALGACGNEPPPEDGGVGATADAPAGSEFVGISEVEASDGRSLTVRTDPYPVDGTGRCHVELAPRTVESESEVVVYVDLVSAPTRPWDDCTLDTTTITVETDEPIDERAVRDALGSTFSFRDGRWQGCDAVVMTCITAPASCEGSSLRDAISNADVPRHFGMSNTRCAAPYAVVDVDYGAGACPPSDGGVNPCAGKQVRRQFWQIVDEAWVLRAATTDAGCGDVRSAEPAFDTSLCADLPAVGG